MVFFTERYLPLFLCIPCGAWEKSLDAQRYTDAIRRLVSRKEPYVLMSEARWAALPDAAARKELADMTNAIGELTKGLSITNVAVLSSRLQVGAATAVAWLLRTKHEVAYVSSAAEGLERSRQAAMSRGLALPAATASLCQTLDRLAGTKKAPPIEELKALL